MDADKIRVLLIEDNPVDALIVKNELSIPPTSRFSVEHVEQLKEGLALLAVKTFDVALLDLGLPDSNGFETFMRLQNAGSEIPIIVLSGRSDEELASKAVQSGAQDYLVKGYIADKLLPRTIRYAMDRMRAQKHLRTAYTQLAKAHEILRNQMAEQDHSDQVMRQSG